MTIWEKFGLFIVGLIARWSFKVLSGILLALGISEGKWEELVGAVISFLIGALISMSQNKFLKQSSPNA